MATGHRHAACTPPPLYFGLLARRPPAALPGFGAVELPPPLEFEFEFEELAGRLRAARAPPPPPAELGGGPAAVEE